MCAITFEWMRNNAIKKFESFDKSNTISWGVLELTDHCNFNCKWCYANANRIKNPFNVDINDVKLFVDTLADSGATQITYSGGEPTMYPRLKEAISIANKKDLIVHMNTNGYLLTKDMALELKNLGLSQVQINIDSIKPEKHDFIRGKNGSHGRALEALKNAKDAGMTCVSQTVLTSENENEILDIIKSVREIDVQRCRVWDMTPSPGCARENSQLIPKNYLEVIQRITDFAYDTGARRVEVSDPMFIPHIKTKLHISGGYCVFGSGIVLYASTNGDVYFCCTLRDKMYNVFEEIKKGNDIRRVHKDAVSNYLRRFGQPKECPSCEHIGTCRTGCFTRRDFSENNSDYWCKKINN